MIYFVYRNVGRISTIKYLMQWFHFQRNIIGHMCTLAQKWSVEALHTFFRDGKKTFSSFLLCKYYFKNLSPVTDFTFLVLQPPYHHTHMHATYKHLQFFPICSASAKTSWTSLNLSHLQLNGQECTASRPSKNSQW